MSHSASQEFLQLFWTNFLSGDTAKAKALSKMAESLKKTNERIEAIAAKASSKREQDMVREALRPTRLAVDKALSSYSKAIAAATTNGD